MDPNKEQTPTTPTSAASKSAFDDLWQSSLADFTKTIKGSSNNSTAVESEKKNDDVISAVDSTTVPPALSSPSSTYLPSIRTSDPISSSSSPLFISTSLVSSPASPITPTVNRSDVTPNATAQTTKTTKDSDLLKEFDLLTSNTVFDSLSTNDSLKSTPILQSLIPLLNNQNQIVSNEVTKPEPTTSTATTLESNSKAASNLLLDLMTTTTSATTSITLTDSSILVPQKATISSSSTNPIISSVSTLPNQTMPSSTAEITNVPSAQLKMTTTLATTATVPTAVVTMAPTSGQKAAPVASGASNNRLIRNYTLFDNRDFLPRTFQIELYEACKSRDTIVFLRPGNGKHFITVMLVKYFAPKTLAVEGPEATTTIVPTGGIPRATETRKVFFLTKSANSIRLYASVFRAHTDFRVHEHLIEDSDLGGKLPWSYEEWCNLMTTNDIHLMLDTTFEALLAAGFVTAANVQLLILDDVHRIILNTDGDDCYAKIIKKLRAGGFKRSSEQYRILGLSASILIEDVSSKVFEEMISQIEQKMDCTCETYADLRMINKYSIPCRIRLHYYPSMFMDRFKSDLSGLNLAVNLETLRLSLFKIRNYTAQFYDFLTNLHDSKLQEQTYLVSHEMLSIAIMDVMYVYGTMGEWCTIKLIDFFNREIMDTISLLKSTKSTYLKLLNSTLTTLQLIKRSVLAYLPASIQDKLKASDSAQAKSSTKLTLQEFFAISSPKLHLLAQLLHNYLVELRSPGGASPIQSTFSFPANICSIVYAERRSTVRVLAAWIAQLASLTADVNATHGFTYLLADYVFLRDEDRTSGTSSIYYKKQQQKSLHEIFYYRRQEEVLKRFRFAHNCNLLVTTSMSAEGLDVNRCNLVVCFDPPRTFQQFIQSKGRVRSENGLFYVMVENTPTAEVEFVRKFRQFCEIETIFTKLVPLANEISIESVSSRKFNRFSLDAVVGGKTGAEASAQAAAIPAASSPATGSGSSIQLTMENAISILNRYCLKLPSDTFTKLAPHYYIDSVTIQSDGIVPTGGASRFQCRLYLPINSTYRDEIRGDPMTNRMMAKRSAAFKAVKMLQEIGELDANYYPVGKETNRYIEKLGLQDCFITTTAAASLRAGTTEQTTTQSAPASNRPGNRFNRLQARNIASKRRQYYHKKVATALSTGECFKECVAPGPTSDSPSKKRYTIDHLYEFEMKLTCPLPEEQNTRGRPLVDPAETGRTFGIIVPGSLPPICDFTIYNRSGEVTVSLKRVQQLPAMVSYDEDQVESLRTFHQYTIESVLRLGKSSLRVDFGSGASNGCFFIVPINAIGQHGGRGIDWDFVQQIVLHKAKEASASQTATTTPAPPAQEEGASKAEPAIPTPTTEQAKPEKFEFKPELYRDAVIIPKYRRDKTQAFFYVAEICTDLTPLSTFPDHGFATFEEYYRLKYGLVITNLEQPLLDVDHTSTRLNLLTPRYLNRKGAIDATHGTTSTTNKKAAKKQLNLQQKQILVPELCTIHPFPASFWRKAVTLPCMLYRVNSLLVAEQLRQQIAREANIGQMDLPPGLHWPSLDFGWSKIVKKAAKELEERKSGATSGSVAAPSSTSSTTEVVEPEGRKNPGYNHGGRPSEGYMVPECKPSGQVKVSSFTVDSFDPALDNFKVASTKAPSPVTPPPTTTAAPEPTESTDSAKTAASGSDDPFDSMGDWTSFAEKVSAEQPDLFKPQPTGPQIEILSFGPSDPTASIFDRFSEELDDDLKAFLQKKNQRFGAPAREEPSIVELDASGNPILPPEPTRPIRIGSPTQFGSESEDDDDDDDILPDVQGEIGVNFVVDMNYDWTANPESADEDSMSGADPCDEQKYSVDLSSLSRDISNMDNLIRDDENFVKEINEYYGTTEDDPEGDLQAGDEGAGKASRGPKEVNDNFEDDASYSDFDVDEMDDEDEFFLGDEEEVDLEDLDDDEELMDDDDDEFDDMPRKQKKGKRGGKKGQSGAAGGGPKKPDATDSSDATGYKAKSFIYDILRYELLYDCKKFEKCSKTPRLYGGDGNQLLMMDRQNRSRNKRIYDRIYRDEKYQVEKCVSQIGEKLQLFTDINQVDPDCMMVEVEEYYTPEREAVIIDRSFDVIPVNGDKDKDERFFDVIFDKFDENDLSDHARLSGERLEDDEEEEEAEDSMEDAKELMANYGITANGSDEVKFGELLPNRGTNKDASVTPEFSFDHAPKTGPPGQPGLCLGPDPSLILQAITMSNSSDGINLERLETVGDSFLKYSITAFLFCMCPDLNEGKLSFLRSRQISNINLHRLGQKIQLGQLMIASKFEPNDNWCPPGYKVIDDYDDPSVDKNKVPYNLLTQHSIPNKSIADCVEALIGTYLISAGSQGAIQFMNWLGLKVMPNNFSALTKVADTVSTFSANERDQWLPMPKSPLIVPKDATSEVKVDLQAKLMNIYKQHRLDMFEEALGYRFRDKAYLVQAFTHNSYYENTVTDCYQRLEFLGDAVLDYLITRYLYEDPRCHSPGTLTDLRSALVNNTFFASLAVKYNFHKYLMMLSFELYRVVDGFVRKFNLCNQNRINEQAAREAEAQEGMPLEEEDPSQRSCVYWELFISENEAEHLEDIEVPKALGDIFESVAGAIFLDSGMSLDAVWRAYYPMMKPEIEYFSYNVPKSPIRVLLEKQPQSAKFGKPEITSGRKIRVCVEVFNVGKFVGVGRNKRIAKCTAAKRALRALKVIDDERAKHMAEMAAQQEAMQEQLQAEYQRNFSENLFKMGEGPWQEAGGEPDGAATGEEQQTLENDQQQ